MSSKYFAYHMKHKFGVFGKSWLLTNKSKVNQGDEVYVISGDKDANGKSTYFLEGLFSVTSKEDGKHNIEDKNGRYESFSFKLNLEEKTAPVKPLLLNEIDAFEKEEFHNHFSSGQGVNTINPKYQTWFDDLLLANTSSDNDVNRH